MKEASCGIVLQARMGSTRLPGKVLAQLDREPMLAVICKRLRMIQGISQLIVATTTLPEDDAIAECANGLGLPIYRGSRDNLVERFIGAARQFNLDHVLRATADNPLVDFQEAPRLVAAHLAGCNDYTTNRTESGSGMPDGCGVEIFSYAALERIYLNAAQPEEYEHINEYVFQHPGEFTVQMIHAPAALQRDLDLTVDTLEQLEKMQWIYRQLADRPRPLALLEVVRFLDKIGSQK